MSCNVFGKVRDYYLKYKNSSLSKDNLPTKESQTKSSVEIKKSHDFDQHISVEVIAEPFTPDAHGHWYSSETIQKGYDNFNERWQKGEIPMNLFHQVDDINGDHIQLLKHYVVPFECDINGQRVKEGTWIGEVKWHNETLWKQRTDVLEDGTTAIAGLSIKGWGKIQDPVESDE